MKKILIMTIATLFGFCALNAQDQKLIDEINKGATLKSEMYWIENQRFLDDLLKRTSYLEDRDLEVLIKEAQKEVARMDQILATRDKIIGKEKKEARINKKLKKHFPEPEKALAYFQRAEEIRDKANMIRGTAQSSYGTGGTSMPEGKLIRFSYTSGNGFAGWGSEVELSRKENGEGKLRYTEKNHNRTPDLQTITEEVKVDDAVFDKVTEIIRNGQFYKIKKDYQPLHEIMDGTGWNMHIMFEKGDISSGGYMAGPDKGEVLSEILKYLRSVFVEIKEKK